MHPQTSELLSFRSAAVGAATSSSSSAQPAPSSFRRAASSPLSSSRRLPLPLGQGVAAPPFMHGAIGTLSKGLMGMQLRAAGRREALEGDDEMSNRIIIQTHSTGAMEELSKGLGFGRTYSPHIFRLRLMAYGTCYPGIMSWVMNLLRGDPFLEEDTATSTPMPEWYRAFRAGAQQRIGAFNASVERFCLASPRFLRLIGGGRQ